MTNRTTPDPDRFWNEILSITTANPGWSVNVRQVEFDRATRKSTVESEETFPIVAWALVKVRYVGGDEATVTEPVFLTNVDLTNSSEYRRMHSDIDSNSEFKTTVSIDVLPPAPIAVPE